MRKQVFGRKFKRDKNQRKALFNGLISAIILKGKIRTTEAKAKAIKGDIEKLVTKAKKEEKIAKKLLQSSLKPFEIEKMITQIAPGFKNRAGGYTRIIKVGPRVSDNASMVILEWSEMETVVAKGTKTTDKKEQVVKKSAKNTKTKTAKPAGPRKRVGK